MASGSLLRKLIKTGADGNLEAFKAISEEVIREERSKNHHLLANDLERILYGRANRLSPSSLSLIKQAPTDKERGIPLLYIREPVRRLEDVVLSDENSSLLDEILREHHQHEVLESYGLTPSDRLLFFGPPGCGKTLTAEVIAAELGRMFAVVRIDSVISSYLGETASNLRQVLEYAAIVPMVVLFDEFDALAKERSDASDHGELKRVVNSFLQLIDSYRGKSLIIAATNHESVLDTAVWRRFDEVMLFENPNVEQIKRLLSCKLRGLRRDFDVADSDIVSLFKGMSHADVERILRRAAKEMVLSGGEFMGKRHVKSAVRREDARKVRVNRS